MRLLYEALGRPPLNQVFNREKMPKEVRNQAIRMSHREFKYPLKDIARHLNMNPNYLCEIIKNKKPENVLVTP